MTTKESLTESACVPCRGGVAPLTDDEIAGYMPAVAGWDVVSRNDVNQLERVFKFGSYQEALDFTQQVGALAEAEDHHPAMLVEWGKVTVNWWTHKIDGLHANDFIAAAKTSALAG